MVNLRLYFNYKGFDVLSISGQDFVAKKKGSNYYFLKYVDFYFIRFMDEISLNGLKNAHDYSVSKANKEFKIPKALRLSVPNINTVFIVSRFISEDVILFSKERKINLVGGQQDSIFVLDSVASKMYCAGREYSYVSGEAKLIWGNSKEFKKLNGHNRSYQLMAHLFSTLGK